MTCLKTGAKVYLYSHGACVQGDLFEVGDVYILSVADPKFCIEHSPTRAHLKATHYEQCGAHAYVFLKENCSDFDYDGWRIS